MTGLDALETANFSRLGDAVESWTTMIGKLKTLQSRAEKELKGKADKANWEGLNSQVTKEFVGKTIGEFEDVVKQATTLRNIMRDVRQELISYRTQLRDQIEWAAVKKIKVEDAGDGKFVAKPMTEGEDAPTQVQIDAVIEKIKRILSGAQHSDETAADALRAISDQAKYGFSNVSYKDRDAAAKALAEAEKYAKLAENPEDLSPQEFDALNRGLGKYKNDPLFAERFAEKLGPDKVLDFWATVNDPRDSAELGHERVDQYGDLQKNLSLTLATATQSDSPAMQRWEREMVRLGDEPVETGGARTQGFKVMSSLMRYGDFDDGFLDRYGNALMKAEKEQADSPLKWRESGGLDLHLNRTGTDTGADPVTGYLKALSNSPDAATEFLNDPYEKSDGGKTVSNYDYLYGEREWVPDVDSEGNDAKAGHEYLGQAAEAGTTGHPAGAKPSVEDLQHTPEQAKLYEDVVQSVSRNPDGLLEHREMADNFGRATAEYMPDINKALSEDRRVDQLFRATGERANLSGNDVTRFLYAVGRDPEGYAAVNLGESNYAASLIEHHFQNPDSYISDHNSTDQHNTEQAVGKVSANVGEVQGILGAARADEATAQAEAGDAQYNDALEKAKSYGSGLAGISAGLVTAPFSGPGAVVAGGSIQMAADEALDAITGDMQQDSSGEVLYRNGAEADSTRASTSDFLQEAATKAGEHSGNPSQSTVSAADSGAQTGYNTARSVLDYSVYDDDGNPFGGSQD